MIRVLIPTSSVLIKAESTYFDSYGLQRLNSVEGYTPLWKRKTMRHARTLEVSSDGSWSNETRNLGISVRPVYVEPER